MGLERDWLNLARTILGNHTESITNVRKKTAGKYNRSKKECQMCCSVTKFKQNREPKRNTFKSILNRSQGWNETQEYSMRRKK